MLLRNGLEGLVTDRAAFGGVLGTTGPKDNIRRGTDIDNRGEFQLRISTGNRAG